MLGVKPSDAERATAHAGVTIALAAPVLAALVSLRRGWRSAVMALCTCGAASVSLLAASFYYFRRQVAGAQGSQTNEQ
jgi:predicted MFS family arabinose efflux permease